MFNVSRIIWIVLVSGVSFLTPSGVAGPGQSFSEARRHWAYQPVRRLQPPAVRTFGEVRSPIDAFLLQRLAEKQLSFSPSAAPRVLLRRVYFNLTGLPPTYEEVQEFEHDPSPAAFARVVDRLLARPQYGERWGRHWLDYARYADTKDQVLVYGKDALRPYAYTYRDYVIRAFNEDLPFDQFITDQLAADLVEPKLPPARLAALGFLTVGRMFDDNPHDQIDDQIDTTTRGFLGLTVACARCHDHKYDAITQRDYYALYGVFASTERPYNLPLIDDPATVPGGEEFERKLAEARNALEKHIDAEFEKLTEIMRQRIGLYLVRAATTEPDLWETTQFGLSLVPEDFRPGLVQRTRRLLERRLHPDDRVFGPWSQLLSLPGDGFAAAARARLRSLQDGHGADRYNPLVTRALAGTVLTGTADIPRVYGELLLNLYEQSKQPDVVQDGSEADRRELLGLVTGPESPVAFPRRETPDHMSRAEKDRYGGLVSALDKLAAHATNAPPARAMVLADLPDPPPARIFKRGNPSQPGDVVDRSFLEVLSDGRPVPFKRGSGRLELAGAIASRSNPLTARVMVNRVWMEHFGEPLVATTSDFGARGEPPAHPELLDWLAAEFMEHGWSLKHLHRVILLSRAYQQSSVHAADSAEERERVSRAAAVDPDNRLLWHYPRRRLDLEAMRDSLLAISGRIDLTVGGRPEDLARDAENRRRTVYGLVDRQNIPSLYRAFDFAIPDQCVERRPRTTVPQQALFSMNSPFVMEQARATAALPDLMSLQEPVSRIDGLFRRVLGRGPNGPEAAAALAFLREAGMAAPSGQTMSGWEQLAQVLLISNEAIHLD